MEERRCRMHPKDFCWSVFWREYSTVQFFIMMLERSSQVRGQFVDGECQQSYCDPVKILERFRSWMSLLEGWIRPWRRRIAANYLYQIFEWTEAERFRNSCYSKTMTRLFIPVRSWSMNVLPDIRNMGSLAAFLEEKLTSSWIKWDFSGLNIVG